MNHSFRHGVPVVLVVVALILGGCASPSGVAGPAWETDLAWQASAVGESGGGMHQWDVATSAMTLTGGGAGLNVKEADQCHFLHIDRPAGDFEILARLTAFASDDASAVAGIMVRPAEHDAPDGAMIALYYRGGDNSLTWNARVPAGKANPVNDRAQWLRSDINLANKGPAGKAPLWLRLVRMDNNFAVYKSRDGYLWTMITNVSGGPFVLEGPLRVGLFCTGAETTTAAFDSIKIGAPHMRYRTGWVGNSFGMRMEDGHVSNAVAAMWVSPDGTCYTSAYWDEGGQPVKAYRDGKVVHGFPIHSPLTRQGGITGHGQRLYVATLSNLTEIDIESKDVTRTFTMSVDLLDRRVRTTSVVSGMAANGKELFIADKRDHKIRVVSLDPVPTYQESTARLNRIILPTSPVEVPEGDERFAPAEIYQSQRVGAGVRYTFPNMQPGASYTIRLHLAEFVGRPENADPYRYSVLIEHTTPIDVAEAAGGVRKAVVKDLPDYKADDAGKLVMEYGTYSGPGICGLEVLGADGQRVLAVNCGGGPVEDFTSEADELVERAFAFDNPGVMAFDKRGHLWIIQRAAEGAEGTPATRGSVKCYTTDGQFTGRQITDVTNPNVLAYDAVKDELLVGEDLPDLNVRVYAKLDNQPTLARTFGEKGGIYAGKTPGVVYDPRAGGHARFYGITGLGVDAAGNLYVASDWQGTDLRMFTPEGTLGWHLYALMFCSTYDVDPASDGESILGTFHHMRLDLDKTTPGSEQSLFAYNWDWRRFGEATKAGDTQSIVRRMGPDNRRIMFCSNQGIVGDVLILRYEGEVAIPCGGTRNYGKYLWIDTNGDGVEDPDEMILMEPSIGWVTTMCIDSRGDLWLGQPYTGGSYMRHFPFKGFNDKGVPLYNEFEDILFPEEGAKTNAWAMVCRMDYDADRDVLIAFYPAVARQGGDDTSPYQYFFGRYDNWSKGNRTATWKHKALTPYESATADNFMYETDLYPYGSYMGMQFVGDYVFFAYIFGEVHVYDAATGKLVEILSMGPEVAGRSAWEDAAMGLRAFQRKNGEYLIFTENSGYGGKNNFFRWTPEKK